MQMENFIWWLLGSIGLMMIIIGFYLTIWVWTERCWKVRMKTSIESCSQSPALVCTIMFTSLFIISYYKDPNKQMLFRNVLEIFFFSLSYCSSSLMSLLRKKKGTNCDIPLVERDAAPKDPGESSVRERWLKYTQLQCWFQHRLCI